MPTVLRFTAYTFTVLIFTASLPAVVEHAGIAVFMENGPVEWLQSGLIAGAAAAFLVGARLLLRFRELLVLLSCVIVFAGFRELDGLLDESVPWVGWKIAFVVFLYAVVSAYKNKDKLQSQLPPFFTTPAFAILWAGFLVTLPIAQLVGHGPFLKLAMEDQYVYEYKQMIEEILELMGYLLLVIGSIESIAQLRFARPVAMPVGATSDKRTLASTPLRAPSPSTPTHPVSSLLAARASLVRRAHKSIASSHDDSWRPR